MENPGRGNKRERWWQAPARAGVFDTDDGGAVVDQLEELLRHGFARVSRYLRSDQPDEWRSAGTLAEWTELRLTPPQLTALTDELTAVVERYLPTDGDQPSPGALPVIIQFQAFPVPPESP